MQHIHVIMLLLHCVYAHFLGDCSLFSQLPYVCNLCDCAHFLGDYLYLLICVKFMFVMTNEVALLKNEKLCSISTFFCLF